MLTWLENDLAATTEEFVICFWHHPPYTKGSHNSDTEGDLIEIGDYHLALQSEAAEAGVAPPGGSNGQPVATPAVAAAVLKLPQAQEN